MRRVTSLLSVLLILFVTSPWLPAATNGAHFFSATASVETAFPNTLGAALGALVVNFDEAGLGSISSSETFAYTLSAQASATYACINGGSNHPKAANKETITEPISAGFEFTPDKNGRVIAAVFAGPAGPGSFSCPSGQSMVLASVSYTGITLTDNTDGVSAASVLNTTSVSHTFFNL